MTRYPIALALLVLAAGPVPPAPAQAAEYPWCLVIRDMEGGVPSCGFVSFEQCMAARQGIGGLCIRNDGYGGPVPRPATRTRR